MIKEGDAIWIKAVCGRRFQYGENNERDVIDFIINGTKYGCTSVDTFKKVARKRTPTASIISTVYLFVIPWLTVTIVIGASDNIAIQGGGIIAWIGMLIVGLTAVRKIINSYY